MKVEVVVDGEVINSFHGDMTASLRFQASIFMAMAEAQEEFEKERAGRLQRAYETLNNLQFGVTKTVPTDPHSKGQEA